MLEKKKYEKINHQIRREPILIYDNNKQIRRRKIKYKKKTLTLSRVNELTCILE